MDRKLRSAAGARVTWIGAVLNLILSAMKLAAGIIGRSEAMIADAIHSLSDLITDIVVLASLKISSRPVDETHPYGHGRVETVGTGILGLTLIAVAAGIFWDSIGTINRGVDYVPTSIAAFGAIISIVVKEWMYRYTASAGKKINSSALVANAWHHRSDALSSVASLFGIGAAMMGWPIFDPIAAILVTFLILKVGVETSRDAFMDIIDTAVKQEIRNKITHAALKTPGAINYHDLKTRKMGSDILVDIHIEVDSQINVADAHDIADKVRDNIMNKVAHIADVLVHIDPEGEADGIVYSSQNDEMEEDIKRIARNISGITCCRELRFFGRAPEMTVQLTAGLSPELTIKEGYGKISELRRKILEIDDIYDADITADLNSKEGEK